MGRTLAIQAGIPPGVAAIDLDRSAIYFRLGFGFPVISFVHADIE